MSETQTIPCESCGSLFQQTAFRASRNMKLCSPCLKSLRATYRKTDARVSAANPMNQAVEIHLRATKLFHVAKLDKRKDEWYVLVKTRKKGSDEPLKNERIYLGVKGGASPKTVERERKRTYARLQLDGAILDLTPKQLARRKRPDLKWAAVQKKKRKQLETFVIPRTIKTQVYDIFLPDPMHPSRQIKVGTTNTKREARPIRDKAMAEFLKRIAPCAHCGRKPTWNRGMLRHVSSKCPNVVTFDERVQRILQLKTWNLLLAAGDEHLGIGRIGPVEFARLGLYKKTNTGMGFSLYIRAMKDFRKRRPLDIPVEPVEEAPEFE